MSAPSGTPPDPETQRLRVVVVHEGGALSAALCNAVRSVGHDAIGVAADSLRAGETMAGHVDVAVASGASPERTLDVLGLAGERGWPCVVVAAEDDAELLAAAAEAGAWAHVAADAPTEELAAALLVAALRARELEALRDALPRRTAIERAKGILMARRELDERAAFELLRRRSAHMGRKVADVAQAVVDMHVLLAAAQPGPAPGDEAPPPTRGRSASDDA